jgi:hypothetical protein
VFESTLKAIDEFHYNLFEDLFDASVETDGGEMLLQKVDEARLSAADAIRNSEVFASILKTPDFTVYVVDDDGLDYHTKARVGT